MTNRRKLKSWFIYWGLFWVLPLVVIPTLLKGWI